MGVTRQYLRFQPLASFGLIASSKGGIVTIPGKKHLVAVSAAENVLVWNIKTGERFLTLVSGAKHEVSCIAVSSSGDNLAAGYEDGTIRIFELDSGDCHVNLNGHKTGVTTLSFDSQGHRLASGAKDTCIIIWDVVNECGLYRLKAHKAPITRVSFMQSRPNVLVSSSKDTFVKFWDLSYQHCFKTLASHVTEVWDFNLLKNDTVLVTGSSDSEIRVWKLEFKNIEEPTHQIEPVLKKLRVSDQDNSESEDEDFDAGQLKISRIGSLLRQSQEKVSHLKVDSSCRLLSCHSSDNVIENFLICSDEEVKKRVQKKAKKERRKLAKESPDDALSFVIPEPSIQEDFRRLKVIKSGGKVRDFDFKISSNIVAFTLLNGNNQIEMYELDLDDKNDEGKKVKAFDQAGHRSDVRTVAFSSDNTAIASVSHESLRVWNRASQTCLRSIGSGYGLCCLFVPGDRQVVVGTKKGTLEIFDLGSASMTEEVEAHSKEVWSICLLPDRKGFVTASADKTLKFWIFELVSFEGVTEIEGKRLSVIHSRTLKLEEDALSVRVSNDGRLVAVSLLDSTVKVFFTDTLKFFLSLYGHKLPAVALDISSDSTLIATASADKNVKIWGLDFGDCHKSIFAHDDVITSIQFIPNTHMFFTASKDGKIKQWDADNFERILTLEGHHQEIWSIAVSPNGKFLVSSGHDKTLRLWERTQEMLVLEDERETERELENDNQLATGDSRVVPGEQDKEVGLPSKKTPETERGAERLMEAIELYQSYQEDLKSSLAESRKSKKHIPPPPLPLLMTAFGKEIETAEEFMAQTLSHIKSSELEETLLVLPLDVVTSLIEIIETLLSQNLCCELVCRTFFFLVEIHFGPLTGAPHLKPLISKVRDLAKDRLKELKGTVGFNLAALRYIHQQADEQEKVQMFLEASAKFREKRKKKKQQNRAIQTAILSL